MFVNNILMINIKKYSKKIKQRKKKQYLLLLGSLLLFLQCINQPITQNRCVICIKCYDYSIKFFYWCKINNRTFIIIIHILTFSNSIRIPKATLNPYCWASDTSPCMVTCWNSLSERLIKTPIVFLWLLSISWLLILLHFGILKHHNTTTFE